jgi:hypothetical protein
MDQQAGLSQHLSSVQLTYNPETVAASWVHMFAGLHVCHQRATMLRYHNGSKHPHGGLHAVWDYVIKQDFNSWRLAVTYNHVNANNE